MVKPDTLIQFSHHCAELFDPVQVLQGAEFREFKNDTRRCVRKIAQAGLYPLYKRIISQ